MDKEFFLKDLANLVNGDLVGNGKTVVKGFGPLDSAGPEDLSFLAKAANHEQIEKTSAGALVVPLEITESEKPLIRVKNPYLASALIQNHMVQEPFQSKGIHQSAIVGTGCIVPQQVSVEAHAVLGEDVVLGERVTIEPCVVIGDNVTIGDDCLIKANVSIAGGCELGARVTIHSGTVIGSDGYGYAVDEKGQHVKRPQTGIVRIGDDVEIGANCCVDRATFGVTWIKSGTKIDNLVQVAHNVVVGENCLLVAQVGIAGSVTLGRNVVFGGGAGAAGHQSIGDGTMVAGRSAVHGDKPAGSMLAGTPAIPAKTWFKAASLFGKIPEIVGDMRRMKKELNLLKEQQKDKD
jgi:UDP-3-O-[3-hydroxymyristoyl] glucosamine N-acyltransferase